VTLDRQRIRQAFRLAADTFDAEDFLHREICTRLIERFELMHLEPARIIDLGAGTGSACLGLQQRFPAADIIAVDLVPEMLLAGKREWGTGAWPVCADAASLPLRSASIDLLFSNLMLPLCPDQAAVMAEARRSLRFPGLFIFSTLGPQSFIEFREAWAEADNFTHILPFTDMHDLGDALVNVGFVEPVVDAELITVTYPSLAALHRDLRRVGSINATENRNPGLTGRGSWERLCASYAKRRDRGGRLPATLEIIYGQAWSDESGRGHRGVGGAYEFPLSGLSTPAGGLAQARTVYS
jgi:malonyl-CoA O-methyltransferase